jgi:pyrroloquinoline quinone biosynthesis protein E
LSFQDSREAEASAIAGVNALAKKIEAARLIRQTRLAFTVNLVVHRKNIDRLEELIAFAQELGPQRIEIANVQYYGWAMKNRDLLLPTREQVERSLETLQRVTSGAKALSNDVVSAGLKACATREREVNRERRQDAAATAGGTPALQHTSAPHQTTALQHRPAAAHIDFVTPDYYGKFPKPCMGGWGRRLMLIDPAGRAMPCHAAAVIPNIKFDNVRERALRWIWEESAAFQMFRGTEWMQDPCKSCPKQAQDFGGCRCQAFLLTGDAYATDPVCSLSPQRPRVDAVLQITNAVKGTPPPQSQFSYRMNQR